MSEGSDVNSSIIPTNKERKDNSSTSKDEISTFRMNEECDAATISTKLECEIRSTSNPMSEESEVNSSLISKIENSKESSYKISKSDECKVNSSTISTSGEYGFLSSKDESNINFSTMPTTEETLESSHTVESSEYTETNSSRCSYQREIEESILEMIKHIEREIESDQHVEVNEDDFQSVEIKIKTSRVLVAIEQIIHKLEIAFCLQWIFVENVYDINSLCGETKMNQLINDYCKIRDSDDMDICRFQPIAINCINNAFEAGLGRFVDLHRHKVDHFI